jgi:hypothetical protein
MPSFIVVLVNLGQLVSKQSYVVVRASCSLPAIPKSERDARTTQQVQQDACTIDNFHESFRTAICNLSTQKKELYCKEAFDFGKTNMTLDFKPFSILLTVESTRSQLLF